MYMVCISVITIATICEATATCKFPHGGIKKRFYLGIEMNVLMNNLGAK